MYIPLTWRWTSCCHKVCSSAIPLTGTCRGRPKTVIRRGRPTPRGWSTDTPSNRGIWNFLETKAPETLGGQFPGCEHEICTYDMDMRYVHMIWMYDMYILYAQAYHKRLHEFCEGWYAWGLVVPLHQQYPRCRRGTTYMDVNVECTYGMYIRSVVYIWYVHMECSVHMVCTYGV